jgi:hypothetical protein
MRTSQLEPALKESFTEIESATSRKRGKKLYMTVKLKKWSLDNHRLMLKIQEALKSYFPRISMTSFGGENATFRLNP